MGGLAMLGERGRNPARMDREQKLHKWEGPSWMDGACARFVQVVHDGLDGRGTPGRRELSHSVCTIMEVAGASCAGLWVLLFEDLGPGGAWRPRGRLRGT